MHEFTQLMKKLILHAQLQTILKGSTQLQLVACTVTAEQPQLHPENHPNGPAPSDSPMAHLT